MQVALNKSGHYLSLVSVFNFKMVAVAITKTQWSVTPSLRVAAFSHRNKIGQPVLVDADLKTKLCTTPEPRVGRRDDAIRVRPSMATMATMATPRARL